ncbi:MAG: glutamine-hydrolyzing GMP synthase [Thermoleophilia bacterium]|nr:glutamine-hydrolyzing GMP synthase [Thermoleophilia bacterium]
MLEASTGEPTKVLVLDFGGQYSQLIARRVRECRVYSELVPYDTPVAEMEAARPAGIILSGGPRSVNDPDAPTIDPAVLSLGVPILGICYGLQLMAKLRGGRVARTDRAEYGGRPLLVTGRSSLFDGVPAETSCWMSHGDSVVEAPDGFAVTAISPNMPVAAMEDVRTRLYGVQFHPEVRHTEHGQDILKNFLYTVCDIAPTWTPVSIIEEAVERIRAQVGTDKVVCGLSGGVDSAVAALLVYKAVGDQLTCIFVDHGLNRKNEGEQVEDTFRRHFHVPLVHVQAQERFLRRLSGVTEPEQKRKIIGEEFIRTFEEESRRLGKARFLVQGTIYPDVIESGTKAAAVIKSHHNVGGLPSEVDFELVEPLRMLFKDEVRVVGEELGLPDDIVWRQPFPGPGLAIRIIGAVTPERLDILREADAILLEEVKKAGLYRELWQSFVVLPAIRSVGVMGDERTYAYPAIIRAVTSDDAMTADWARLPYDFLEAVSQRIINEVPGVNRVALDISSKPPSTIEWE